MSVKDITKDTGVKLATDSLDSDVIEWYSLDCPPIDIALGKGVPGGRIIEIFGPPSSGKCLAVGSLISMANGSLKKIENVKEGDKILCINDTLKIDRTVVEATASQKQECFKITLRDGRWVEVSLNHPFLTIHGWKKLSDLKIGDYIATPRVLPVFHKVKNTLTETEAELIGIFLGDGCTSSGNLNVTIGDYEIELIDRFKELIIKFNAKLRFNTIKKKGAKCITIRVSYSSPHSGSKVKNPLKEFFEGIGVFGLTGANKFVPDCVTNGSNKIITACLRGLFETDGCECIKNINPKHGGNKCITIHFSNKSEKMVYQVQHMLLRLGILSSVRYKHALCSTTGKRFNHWCLSVITRESKRKMLNIMRSPPIMYNILDKPINNENNDFIPNEACNFIHNVQKVKKLDWVEYHLFKRKNNISRLKLNTIGISDDNTYLILLSNSDIYWDRIKQITAGQNTITYDLQTKSKNFIANNIFVHNSTIATACSKAFTDYHKAKGSDKYAVLQIETESVFDKVRARYMGCDIDSYMVSEAETVEEGFDVMNKTLVSAQNHKMSLFINWDTIAAAPTANEKGGGEGAGLTEKPRIIRRELRKLTNLLSSTNSTLILCNQIYHKIGSFIGGIESPGGEGIKFHSSIRIEVRKKEDIDDVLANGNKVIIGIMSQIITVKNKLTLPKQTIKIYIHGEKGIDKVGTTVQFLIDNKYITKSTWKYIKFKDQEFKWQTDAQRDKILEASPILLDYFNYLCYKHQASTSPLLKVRLIKDLWVMEKNLGLPKTDISESEKDLARLIYKKLQEGE